jgi:WD40-like Beta Propeller Repeat
MSRTFLTWCAFVFAILVSASPIAAAGELPKSATVLDPDIYLYSWPYPTISPDGNWVAYVSNGFVCVCNVKRPVPRRIMEVPHSWTWPHFVIHDGASSRGPFGSTRVMSRGERRALLAQVTKTVYGLNWTSDSAGFVFGIQDRDAAKKQSQYDAYFTTVDGAITKLAHISPDTFVRSIAAGILTRDRRYLVSAGLSGASDRYRPLIWNVKDNKPKATPFLYLTPSKTSTRWLGIEKDTRQLVIVDGRFEVIKRFDEYAPQKSFGFRLEWSPDDRYIIWRNQIGFDYFNNWEGFWMDLQTGRKRNLDGRFMDEQLTFTGRGGEFFRCGRHGMYVRGWEGDQVTGVHLTLVPDNGAPPRDVWRMDIDPKDSRSRNLTNPSGFGALRMSPDAKLFAVLLPRPTGGKAGGFWHLINCEGKKWRLPGDDNGEFVAPFELAGFGDSGKLIVAYDKSRLFTIPVSSVLVQANEVE